VQRRQRGQQELIEGQDQEPGTRQPHGDPQAGAQNAQRQALANQQPGHLAAGGAEGSQNRQLSPPLGDVHQECIPDDERRQQHSERRRHLQAQVAGEQGLFDQSRAARRAIHVRTGGKATGDLGQ
jgi:hypothetical protein